RRQCDRAAAALRRAAPRRVAGGPGRVPGEAAAGHRRLRRHDSPSGRVGQRAGARTDAAAGRLAGGGRVTARRRLSATHGPPARAFFWSMLAAVLTACAPHTAEVAPRSGRDPAAAARTTRDTALEQRAARLELRLLERDAQLEELQARLDEARQEVVRAMAKLQTVASRAEAASAIAEGEIAVQSLRAAAAAQPATGLAQATTLLQQAGAEFAKQNYGGALYLANQAKRVAGAGKRRLGDAGRAPPRRGGVRVRVARPTRFRPSRFAWYKAASAPASRSSGDSPSSGNCATPTLSVSFPPTSSSPVSRA